MEQRKQSHRSKNAKVQWGKTRSRKDRLESVKVKPGRVGVSSLEETGKECPFYSLAPTIMQVSEQKMNSIRFMTWGGKKKIKCLVYLLSN